jgi:hypothetical protein
MLLFSPDGSFQQLWLVSSSPNKVGKFSFLHHPQSQDTSSVICHILALKGWLLISLLFSRVNLVFTPSQMSVVNCIHSLCCSVLFEGCNLSTTCTGLWSWQGVWCTVLSCWVWRFTYQLCNQAGGEKRQAAFLKAGAHWNWVQDSRVYVGFPH